MHEVIYRRREVVRCYSKPPTSSLLHSPSILPIECRLAASIERVSTL